MALSYGLLVVLHVVFALFFGLTAVCLVRGASLYVLRALASQRERAIAPVERGAALARLNR
jgi:hypothetical protein